MADETGAPPQGDGAGAPAAPKIETPRDRLMAVVREVAERHGLLVSDLLMGPKEPGARRRDRAHARREAMVLIGDRFPHMSTPQIGAFFGGRDHTTVLYAREEYAKQQAVEERGRGG